MRTQKCKNNITISKYQIKNQIIKKKSKRILLTLNINIFTGSNLKGQPEHDGTCKYYYSRDYHMIIKCLSCDASWWSCDEQCWSDVPGISTEVGHFSMVVNSWLSTPFIPVKPRMVYLGLARLRFDVQIKVRKFRKR